MIMGCCKPWSNLVRGWTCSLAMIAAATAALPASAEVITFNGLAFDGGSGTPEKTFGSVTVGDYVFTALLASEPLIVRARNDPNNADPGGATLGIRPVGSDPGFRFERIDGAAFDVTSIQVTQLTPTLSGPDNSGTLGFYFDGAVGLLTSFDGNPPFQTYALNGLGVRSVRVTGNNYFQVDNIVVSSNVPEPGTWIMMVMGIGAIGFGMRSRRTICYART